MDRTFLPICARAGLVVVVLDALGALTSLGGMVFFIGWGCHAYAAL
jgi:uncharacterized membrane protein YgdD (TMEM256/DUF423 family)